MRPWVMFRSWLRTVLRRTAVERELDDELRFHLDEEMAAALRSGRTLDEARRMAAASLGDAPHRLKEECRDARGTHLIDAAAQDLRIGCRSFLRAPGFTVSALLILAVGNAAVTTMFALVNGVLLQPLPVRDQAALVVVSKQFPGGDAFHVPFRPVDDHGNRVLDFIEGETVAFDGIAGVNYNGALPVLAGEDAGGGTIRVAAVTGDFFDVLGLTPTLGRMLQPADDVTGAEKVVVLTEGLWRRRYGGSADVIGRRLQLNRASFVVVGVVPDDLDYPRGVEAFLTITALTATLPNPAFIIDVNLVARLRAGVTREQGRADLQQLLRRVDEDLPPNATRGAIAVVRPFADVVVGDSRTPLLILLAAVVLVLLVASANVASLCLMRAESRREEFAIRTALGAGRTRLVAQLLIENAALSLAAVGAGVLLAWWAMPMLVASLPEGLPRVSSPRIDLRVVFMSAALALVTTVLTGVVPALHQVQRDGLRLRPALSKLATRQRLRRLLVAGQVAVALTGLAAAALLARSLLMLQTVDTGLTSDRLVFTAIDLPHREYVEPGPQLRLLNEAADQITSTPGIHGVTAVAVPPFAGPRGWDVPRFTAEGQDDNRAAGNPTLNLESVLPSYFDTLGIELLRGRAFTDGDRRETLPAAIVSEDVAARVWPGADPIGKRMKIGPLSSEMPWLTIVGVAAGTRYRDLRETRPTVYLPAAQFIVASQMLVVRTGLSVAAVDRLVRERLRAIDPDIQVLRTAGFGDLMVEPLSRPRFFTLLGLLFGGITLLLSAAGLYSVVNASVRQRDREIGVRVALGASRGVVLRLIMREGLQLAGAGLVVGFAIAVALTRFLDQLLFAVQPLDPASLLAAMLVLVAVTAVASLAPAIRATRMNPMDVLRTE